MLHTAGPKPAIEAAIQRYLYDVLGVVATSQPWAGLGRLPYFLQEAYELRQVTLFDRPLLLAINRQTTKPALAGVRGQLDKIRAIAGYPVVYVTGVLASYERRHLIKQKVPFIVPGNQLYLPDFGIDLREHFRGRAPAPDAPLSPATQAVLIAAALRAPWQVDWQPAPVVSGLGYTPMTGSRVVKELLAAGIATLHSAGKARWLRMEHSAADTWQHARPLLRSPVRRRVWVPIAPDANPRSVRLAGLSALARHTMLADPAWSTYAIGPSQWKALRQAGVETLRVQVPGTTEWQLWHYSPALVPNSETVDPLSLTLSLQDDADERVQSALDELRGNFPW
jgi:hypothetical protein